MSSVKDRINAANREAVRRMIDSVPVWVDVCVAGEVIPRLGRNVILHAGPPLPWDRMCAPQRSAICGAAVYEGLAETIEEAAEMVASGQIEISPCHERRAVGSMCGVTSFRMPVLVI